MTTYPEPDADVPEEEATEATSRTLLKRELRAQALLRLEDGARTEDDTVWLSLDRWLLEPWKRLRIRNNLKGGLPPQSLI